MSTEPPDRRRILDFLATSGHRPLRARELARELGVRQEGYRAFRRLLSELERDGEIFRQRQGRYGLPERFEALPGRLQITRAGDGFVVPDEPGREDVFVPGRQLDTAQDGDRVVVRVDRKRPGRNPEGRIVRVLERATSQVVGPFHRRRGVGFVVPQEPPLTSEIVVPSDRDGGAAEGDVVLVEIEEWGKGGPAPIGRVTKVLGKPGDPGVEVLGILLGHQLPLDFPPGVEAEAGRIGRRGVRPEDLADRDDFRDRLVFTIDPADARDHDDAVSAREMGDGTVEIGVHIADVSFYVKRGAALDREAGERATSVYLVDRVVPMLPEELSSRLCSLVPGEDRLVVSVVFRVGPDGAILERRLARGVIRSAHRLSYEQAQALLDGKAPEPAVRDGEVIGSLRRLSAFARTLRKARERAGAIDFALPEARVELDGSGEPVAIHARERLEAHRLIEDLMILANETVAELGVREGLPFVYRIHEPPAPDRLEGLRSLGKLFGYSLPAADVRPRDVARLVESQRGTPREYLVSAVALRSMRQARYSTRNVGHFGLASEAYAHFTSPIRRYPDLLVHREIVRWIEGRKGGGGGPAVEELEASARHCSERERKAEEAERDSVAAKTIRYMERHLGDHMVGTVSGVTGFGLFVLLDEVLTEGLVRVSSLVDDYYVYEEEAFSLTGRRTRRRLRLGDRVRVQVVRVDAESRQIDLELLEGPLDPERDAG